MIHFFLLFSYSIKSSDYDNPFDVIPKGSLFQIKKSNSLQYITIDTFVTKNIYGDIDPYYGNISEINISILSNLTNWVLIRDIKFET